MSNLILVTGATGTVGTEVVRQLLQSGHDVRVLVRDAAKAASGSEVAVGDLLRPQTLAPAFEGVQKAFILAPPGPEMEKMEINAFIAAEQAGVEHIVYLSNFGAGRFNGPLWDAHGANEWRLRSLRSAWTILRPTRFMTNVPFVWTTVRERGRFVEALGGRPVVVIDPRDVAAVAVQSLTMPGHDGKLYELSAEALSGLRIAEQLATALGRPVEFIDASVDETRKVLLDSGFPESLVEPTLVYFETVRSSGHWYETSTLAELLGRPPRTFSDFLGDNVSR
jgi:uncharacterized protein YbjT (DUF2867 family)